MFAAHVRRQLDEPTFRDGSAPECARLRARSEGIEAMTRAKQDMIAAACCEFGPATSEEELRAALDTIDRLRRRPDASNAPEVAMLMVTRAELAEAIKAMEEGVRRRRRARRRDRVAARQQ